MVLQLPWRRPRRTRLTRETCCVSLAFVATVTFYLNSRVLGPPDSDPDSDFATILPHPQRQIIRPQHVDTPQFGLVFSVDGHHGRQPLYRQRSGHTQHAYGPYDDIHAVAINKTSVQFIYPRFVPKPPIYFNSKDRRIFESQFPDVNITARSVVHVTGNACVTDNSACLGHVADTQLVPRSDQVLFSLPVPAISCSLHDLIQSAIPAVAQGAEYITQYNATVVVPSHCDQLSKSLLENINLDSKPIRYSTDQDCPAKLLIQTCNAPVASPALWQKVRDIWEIPISPPKVGTVILITRGTLNGKVISVADEHRVATFLRGIYGNAFEVIAHPLSTVRETRGTFEKAAIIVGIPSDQMDLMVFSPPGTTVLEFLPYGDATARSSWHLAAALGHRYVVSYEDTPALQDTVPVNPERVATMLRRLGHVDNRNRPQTRPKMKFSPKIKMKKSKT